MPRGKLNDFSRDGESHVDTPRLCAARAEHAVSLAITKTVGWTVGLVGSVLPLGALYYGTSDGPTVYKNLKGDFNKPVSALREDSRTQGALEREVRAALSEQWVKAYKVFQIQYREEVTSEKNRRVKDIDGALDEIFHEAITKVFKGNEKIPSPEEYEAQTSEQKIHWRRDLSIAALEQAVTDLRAAFKPEERIIPSEDLEEKIPSGGAVLENFIGDLDSEIVRLKAERVQEKRDKLVTLWAARTYESLQTPQGRMLYKPFLEEFRSKPRPPGNNDEDQDFALDFAKYLAGSIESTSLNGEKIDEILEKFEAVYQETVQALIKQLKHQSRNNNPRDNI